MSFTWVDAGSDTTHASSNGSVSAGGDNANAGANRQKRGNFNNCCDYPFLFLRCYTFHFPKGFRC